MRPRRQELSRLNAIYIAFSSSRCSILFVIIYASFSPNSAYMEPGPSHALSILSRLKKLMNSRQRVDVWAYTTLQIGCSIDIMT